MRTTNRAQRATFALMALRYKEQLGEAIRERRLALGLTQRHLADRVHMKNAQEISRWERGVTEPSNLQAVAKALETTITELVAGIELDARQARQLGMHSRNGAPDLYTELNEISRAIGELREEFRALAGQSDQRVANVGRELARLSAAVASLRQQSGDEGETPLAAESPRSE